MRTTLNSYLSDFFARGDDIAFSHRRGLRTVHWSYRHTAETATEFAHLLADYGIKQGDRILISGGNSPEWVAAFFACLTRGAIVVPLDVQSEPAFVKRAQQQVAARLAIWDVAACERFPSDLRLIPLEQLSKMADGFTGGTLASGANSSESVLRNASESPEFVTSVDDPVEVIFTSGTTAQPKGVVITHRNLLANLQPLEREIQRYRKWERLVHPIRFLNLVPLSHVFGQFMGMFVPQLLGGQVFFSDSLKAVEIIETVRRERISVIVCVPRMLETLRESIESSGESGGPMLKEALATSENLGIARRWWRFRDIHKMYGWKFWAFVSGGATLDRETEEFWQRLGFAVIQGYGMTETASLVTVNHPFKKKLGSIGAVIPGQEVRLDVNGEILVRGPSVSPGYWGDQGMGERSTGKRGNGERVGSDTTYQEKGSKDREGGWFHTGDIGEVDREGNLFFKGRQKEVIVTSAGMNIYPEDLEAVVNHQPEVKCCAVVGVEGPHGPEPVAILILGTPHHFGPVSAKVADAQAKLVVERANQSLAEFQKIRRWFIWPESDFPRTPTQKIKRHLIAERIKSASRAHPDSEAARPNDLASVIAQVSGETARQLQPGENLLTDLKLDSLGRVELLSAIEDHYGIEIDEATFSEATTVADVEGIIGRTPGKADQPDSASLKSKIAQYPYPTWPHRWPINWLRIAALHLIIFSFVRILGRASVSGVENLSGQNNPLLFISNHLTMVDHALILWALPSRFQIRMSIAMDGELLREWLHPTSGISVLKRLQYRAQYLLVAFFFNIFSMPQHTGFRRSFKFAGEMMDRGYSVLVFPEGRRSPDGKLQPLRPGIGMLAKELDVPVVPVRIDGLYELAQEKRHRAPKGAVKVTIGKPVRYSRQAKAEEITEDLTRRLVSPMATENSEVV